MSDFDTRIRAGRARRELEALRTVQRSARFEAVAPYLIAVGLFSALWLASALGYWLTGVKG